MRRKTNTLPTNIGWDGNILRVQIERRGVLYTARVPRDFGGTLATAIAEAVRWRDYFLGTIPPKASPYPKSARSNTGLVGISETVTWHRGWSANCFNATYQHHGRRHFKKFTYTTMAQREVALKRAIKWRARLSTNPGRAEMPLCPNISPEAATQHRPTVSRGVDAATPY